MLEIVKNTLKIIGMVSYSSVGYILEINSSYSETIAFFGSDREKYELLNAALSDFYHKGKLTESEVINSSAYNLLKKDLSIESVYLKKIRETKENSSLLCLILLSTKKNNYTDTMLNNMGSVVSVLKDQLAEWKKDNTDMPLTEKYTDAFNLLMETSDDLIFMLDQHGNFISVNKHGAAAIDYTVDELLGRHFFELIAPKNKPEAAKIFHNIMNSQKISVFEITLMSKLNVETIFEFSCKVSFNGSTPVGLLSIGKNITKLRHYEDKIKDITARLVESERIIDIERSRSNYKKSMLAELNKIKSEFVSNISHELRTPLASIVGFSETMVSDPQIPDEMKQEFNQIILNEGKRLAKLVNEVLDVSKVEAGKIELVKSKFDVCNALQEVITQNEASIEKNQLALSVNIPKDEIFINGDSDKIKETFNAIISNAVKFNYPKGRIAIILQNLYKEVEIIFSDTGMGIPQKDIPYIFDKFYRVSRPGTEIAGTGLGLVFVKQIVDLHKGFITVQSGINRGTSVIIKLPKI